MDWYKQIFKSLVLAISIGKGKPYKVDGGWKLTTHHPEPYYRPKQKRENQEIIEKALDKESQ